MSKYKVHDHGKVTFVWDEDDHCEALGHWYSYERLGLYYRTRNGPVPFCDLHFWWITDTIVFQSGTAAYYTAPGDRRSARTRPETRWTCSHGPGRTRGLLMTPRAGR